MTEFVKVSHPKLEGKPVVEVPAAGLATFEASGWVKVPAKELKAEQKND